MAQRLRFGTGFRGCEYLLQLTGELDGSTAGQVSVAPASAREVVLDLPGPSRLKAFGLDILQRGVRGRAPGRPVRFEGVAFRV